MIFICTQLEGENQMAFRFGANGALGGYQYVNGESATFEDDDQFQLGSLEYEKEFSAVFPNSHNSFGMNFYGQAEIIFEQFIYFQGAHFRTADLCRDNAVFEAGRDEDAYPLSCASGYKFFHEVNKCVKLNDVETDFCMHDMDSEASQCHRCKRGWGNKDKGPCEPCFENCLTCTGQSENECTYCDLGYGFTGSNCVKCVTGLETFDSNLNICQPIRQHNLDMWGDGDTIGELQIYFTPLDGFSDNSVHIENFLEKYWVSNLSKNYHVVRRYDEIPRHRKISISLEVFILDLTSWEFVYIAVDGRYVKQINAISNDPYMTEDIYDKSYTDWVFKTVVTDWHFADSCEIGIIGKFSNLLTNLWIRDIKVDFFGCYFTCSDCWIDNSPLHCTACEDSYFLENFQCKACDTICQTCVDSADNCLSCFDGKYLKFGSCVPKCELGFFIENGNECKPCPVECTQCLSLTNCIACQFDHFLSAGACVTCNAACLTCKGSASFCTSCNGSLLLESGSCVVSCSSNYYQEGSNCVYCGDGCASCNPSTCLSCLIDFKFKGNICVSDCGNGYYEQNPTTCALCHSSCANCLTTASNCTSCPSISYLDGSDCLSCVSPCESCGSAIDCDSCVDGYFLKGDECLEDCGIGFFGKNRKCIICDLKCKTCQDNKDFCLECSTGYFLKNNGCYEECGEGFFEFNDSLCCMSKCLSCEDSVSCIDCNTGYYKTEGTCEVCDASCLSCEENADNCTACPENKFLIENSCYDTCPQDKYYELDGSCLECHHTCLQCTGQFDSDCTECPPKRVLYNFKCHDCEDPASPFGLIGEQCVDKCGDGRRFTPENVPGLYSYNACDDGNVLSGDGCTANCQIEANFDCEGGSPSQKDTCFETIAPTVFLRKNHDQLFTLSFTEPVFITEGFNMKDAVNITVKEFKDRDGFVPKFDEDTVSDITEAEVAMNYWESFDNYTVSFRFNRSLIRDKAGNMLKTIELFDEISFYIPERAETEQFLNMTTTSYSYLYYASAVTSTMIGTYLSSVSVFNFMDISRASHFVYLNSQTNTDVEYMLYGMARARNSASNFVFNHTFSERRLIGMNATEIKTDIEPVHNFLTETLLTPHNYVQDLNFIFLLSGLVLLLFSKLFLEENLNKNMTWMKRQIIYFVNRFALFMFYLNYIPLTFFSLINIRIMRAESVSDILLIVISFFIIILNIVAIIIVAYLCNKPMITLWHPYYYNKFGFVYSDFKLDKRRNKLFPLFYILKNFLFVFFLAVLIKSPLTQSFILLLLSFSYIVLMLRMRPFISIYFLIFASAIEILEFGVLVCFTIGNFLYRTTDNKIRDENSIALTILFTGLLVVIVLRLLFIIFLRIRNEFKYIRIVLKKDKNTKKINADELEMENSSNLYLSSENKLSLTESKVEFSDSENSSMDDLDIQNDEDRELAYIDQEEEDDIDIVAPELTDENIIKEDKPEPEPPVNRQPVNSEESIDFVMEDDMAKIDEDAPNDKAPETGQNNELKRQSSENLDIDDFNDELLLIKEDD